MMTRTSLRRAFAAPGAAAVLSAMALLAGGPAGADSVNPVVALGPVTVANGTAALSGSLGGNPSSLSLAVNGNPVTVDASGAFAANVDLAGQSAVTLALTDSRSGSVVTTRIPLTTNVLGPDGVVPATVLDALQKAGVSVEQPEDGFRVLDGKPLEVSGSVADTTQLSKLLVNGVDVLGKLTPSGSFEQTVPGTSDRVTVTSTDKQGVSQTFSYEVQHTSSTIATPAGVSVASAGADGVRVAAVRYRVSKVRATKRLTMTVTVKDRLGRLVRDAVVRVRVANFQVRRHFVRGGQQAKFSSKVGTASFVLRVNKIALGKRVFMFSVARTPSATGKRTTSVLLPHAKRR